MTNIRKKITGLIITMLVTFSSFSGNYMIVMAENASVNTETIGTINLETSTGNTDTTTEGETTTEPTTETDITSTDKNLKENLYSGNILVDQDTDFDDIFEKLIVKGRELVENVRKAIIPWLVLAWIGLFGISVLRIITGERGASSKLVGGLLLITIAYCGIVYAELIIGGMVHFFVA